VRCVYICYHYYHAGHRLVVVKIFYFLWDRRWIFTCDSEEIRSSSGHVTVQVVSRWPRTVNARVVTRPFRVRFMVKEVGMRQISTQVLLFPLSIPFHQWCLHIFILLLFLLEGQGTAVAQSLRWCVTNRKVAGSIPAVVIGIFHWYKTLPIALWPWGLLSL